MKYKNVQIKLEQEVDPAADVMIGTTIDENLKGKLRVSIVATGLGGEISRNKPILVHNQNYTNIQPRPNPVNHNPYALNNFQKQSLNNRSMNTTMTGSYT